MVKKQIVSDAEKLSYALGMSVVSNLIRSGVETLDIAAFTQALTDTFKGEKPALSPEEANQILENFMESLSSGDARKNLEEGMAFLAQNSQEKGVVELPSGLQYLILKQGEGKLPTLRDRVRCHYHGTLIDGTVFDSSVNRGQPAEFPVNGVIQGWIEALQLMPVGSKWRLFIPSDLAYGDRGAGNVIGPNATLIFEVELLNIV